MVQKNGRRQYAAHQTACVAVAIIFDVEALCEALHSHMLAPSPAKSWDKSGVFAQASRPKGLGVAAASQNLTCVSIPLVWHCLPEIESVVCVNQSSYALNYFLQIWSMELGKAAVPAYTWELHSSLMSCKRWLEENDASKECLTAIPLTPHCHNYEGGRQPPRNFIYSFVNIK